MRYNLNREHSLVCQNRTGITFGSDSGMRLVMFTGLCRCSYELSAPRCGWLYITKSCRRAGYHVTLLVQHITMYQLMPNKYFTACWKSGDKHEATRCYRPNMCRLHCGGAQKPGVWLSLPLVLLSVSNLIGGWLLIEVTKLAVAWLHPYLMWWNYGPRTAYLFKSWWPSDVIWRDRSGKILAQVMACCLSAPNHYLSHWWMIISNI